LESGELQQGHAPCECGEFTHVFRQIVLQRLPKGYCGELCPRCNLLMCRMDRIKDVKQESQHANLPQDGNG
jgi:hypothetical protein